MNYRMKRTTLVLDEHRLVQLKRLAAERRQSLSAVVDEFLRAGLEGAKSGRKVKPRRLPPGVDMGEPAVNIADRDQLYDFLDRR